MNKTTNTSYNLKMIKYLTIIIAYNIICCQGFNSTTIIRGVKSNNITYISSTIPINKECPICMTYNNDTQVCHIKKCYKWDGTTCEKSGKSLTTAIVLQAIPFTGAFGSGFGNIGRWDLFAIPMSVIFGGCCFGICSICLIGVCKKENDDPLDDKEAYMLCYSNCFGCLYGCTIFILWIWGIVIIATKSILDGNGCELVT